MALLLSLLLGVYLSPLVLSDLIFNVQPDVITPVLTSQLVINCSITNNQVPDIDVIKSLSLSRYNKTNKDFYVLLSLDSKTFNLQQFVQFRHAQVSFGNLFLSLTVYNPVQSDAQAYRCNVEGDNSIKKNVSINVKKGVGYEPNVTALIQEITRLKISEDIGDCSTQNIRISGNSNARSKLHFVGNSKLVKEYIEPLTLRCSFLASNEDAHQDSAVQFMYILHETNGVIATISRDQPRPTASQKLNFVTLLGELNESISKNSFLQVTWRSVKLSDSGKYFCGAHLNNVIGQRDMFQQEFVVSVQSPTHDDLVKVVYELQRQGDKWKDSQLISERNMSSINGDLRTHNQSIMSVKEDLKNYQQKIESFREDLTTSQQNIQSVKMDFRFIQRHIETVRDDLNITKHNIENVNKEKQQNMETFKQDIESVKESFKSSQEIIRLWTQTIYLLSANLSDFQSNVAKLIYEGNTNYTFLHEPITSLRPESCRDVISTKDRKVVTLASGLKVMCDTKTVGGGWIIFQRRFNGNVDFYRGWKEYRDGFGNYNIGEFYLGNENIFKLTSSKNYDLRIDLEFNNTKYFALYTHFKVLGEEDFYKLQIGGYSGNAGDELTDQHNNMFFSTYDKDNDNYTTYNCAEGWKAAWWYNSCFDSNLNGKWGSNKVNWHTLTSGNNSVTFTEMKIREIELD